MAGERRGCLRAGGDRRRRQDCDCRAISAVDTGASRPTTPRAPQGCLARVARPVLRLLASTMRQTRKPSMPAWRRGSMDLTMTRPPRAPPTISFSTACRRAGGRFSLWMVWKDPGRRCRRWKVGRVVDGSMRDFLLNAAEGDASWHRHRRHHPFQSLRPRSRAKSALHGDNCREDLARGLPGSCSGITALEERRCPRRDRRGGRSARAHRRPAGGYLGRFCGGDATTPLHFATPEELDGAVRDTRAPRLRYVAQQNVRFAKLAQQYSARLAAADPAALSLLERICLFRLGVSKSLLVSTFIGPDKVGISGPRTRRAHAARCAAQAHAAYRDATPRGLAAAGLQRSSSDPRRFSPSARPGSSPRRTRRSSTQP